VVEAASQPPVGADAAAMRHRAGAVEAATSHLAEAAEAATSGPVVVEHRSGVAAVAVVVESSRTKPRPCRLQ
jgi:hypothetical protein